MISRKKLPRLLILAFALLCFSNIVHADPIITSIVEKDADCSNNGEILAVVSNVSGVPTFKLDKLVLDASGNPTGQIESSREQAGVNENKFVGIEAGKYYVYVYDDVTGLIGIQSRLIIIKDASRSFRGTAKAETINNTSSCTETGSVTFTIPDDDYGKPPYSFKLVNKDSGREWLRENQNSKSSTFSALPGGTYSYIVTDACGASFFGDNLQVVSKGTLEGIVFNTFKCTTPVISGNGGHCDRMSISIQSISSIRINGQTLLNNRIRDVKFEIEYPAGSGEWKYFSTMPAMGSNAEIAITDFDPNNLKYRIRVRNSCDFKAGIDNVAIDPTIYEFPKPVTTITAGNKIDYRGLDFCSVPEFSDTWFTVSQKAGNYSCNEGGNYPLKVAFTDTQTGEILEFTWNKEDADASGKFHVQIKTNITYNLLITDATGEQLFARNYSVPASLPTFSFSHSLKLVEECNVGANALYYNSLLSTVPGTTLVSSYIGQTLKFKITAAPIYASYAVGYEKTKVVTSNNTSNDRILWENLPGGRYEIEIDKGCGTPTKVLITSPSTPATAEYTRPRSVIKNCMEHQLKFKVQFYDVTGAAITNGYIYAHVWWVNPDPAAQGTPLEYKKIGTYTSMSSGVEATSPEIKETGRFIVRYSSSSVATVDDPRCDFMRYDDIYVDKTFKDPEINLAESGGISCTEGGETSLTVSVSNPSMSALTYQIKEKGAPDTSYSLPQTSNVFDHIVPGVYDVKINSACDGTNTSITYILQVFDGIKDKFMSLSGSFINGETCSNQSATFAVKAIGPVQSYKWFKNGVPIAGETKRTYTIPNVTAADIATYTVEIETIMGCTLRSSDEIKKVLPTPEKPTIASECFDAGAVLTAQGTDTGSSFIWYKDGNMIAGNTTNTCQTTGQGYYTVVEKTTRGCLSYPSDPAIISLDVMYWKDNAPDGDWSNSNNWLDKNGNAVTTIPGVCTAIHVGGLNPADGYIDFAEINPSIGTPVCKDIIFHYGGRVYSPHKLRYQKAFVQYNFGYYNGSNVAGTQPTGNIESKYPVAHAVYPPIGRGGWHLISAPLKNMVSGDFSLSGYPYTWQSLVNMNNPATGESGSTGSLTEASFTKSFVTNDMLLSKTNDAFALNVELYNNGVGKGDHKYLEALKGVLQYPYFQDQEILDNRPGYFYDNISNMSYLSYFDLKTLQTIYQPVGKVKRGNESYRFIFEDENNKVNIIEGTGTSLDNTPGYVQTLASSTSDFVLLGNPFMSAISFNAFVNSNPNSIDKTYGYSVFSATSKVWNNTLNGTIAPLQAFVVRVKPGATKIVYPMTLTEKGTTRSLVDVSQNTEYNGLSVGATISGNQLGDKAVLVSVAESEELYVPKLIYPDSHSIPEVYFVSPAQGSNLRQGYKHGDSEIALGVKCSNTQEPITLNFSNINVFEQGDTRPVLTDKVLNISQDLTESSNYTFYQQLRNAKGQYADNNRFVITFVDNGERMESKIDIRLRNRNELTITSNSNLAEVSIFDLQGRKLNTFANILSPNYQKTLDFTPGVYVVKAKTVDGETKSHKISIF